MPEGYKKRILQGPGQEIQSITERPSEAHQLELPDFKIPTVTNFEDSIMRALANRKARDIYNQAYDEYLEQHPISSLSGIGYNPYIGTQFHPEVQRQQAAHLYAQDKSGYVTSDPIAPYKQSDEKFANISSGILGTALFAPEFTTYGLLGGAARIGGGMLGSGASSKIGNELGYALDNTFKTRGAEPAGEIIGAFVGGGKGSRLLSNIAENRALKYVSRTGKQLPKWFINYDPIIGKINARTIFAEDQTPVYNSRQISDRFGTTKYTAPEVREISISPKLSESVSFNSNINALKNNIFKEVVERAGVPVKGQLTSSPTGMSILKAQIDGTYDPSYFGGLTLNPNYYYRRGGGIIDDALATDKIRVPEEGYIKTAIKKYPGLDNGNPFSTTLKEQKFPYFREETFWPSGGKFGVEPEDLIAIPKGLPGVNGVAGSKLGALKPYSKPSEFGGRATPLVDGQTNIFPTEHSLLFKLNPETKEYLPLRKAEYQAPQTTIKSVSPQMAYTSDFSGVENIESGNFGYGGVKPNLGLRKFFTERRAKQLLNSITEEQKRNASALNGSGKNGDSLTSTEQYGLKTLHGGEGNEFLIIPGTNQTGFLSLNEDYPKETMPMGKRVGHIVRKAQDDLRAMNSYHIQNVEEGNKLNEKNFKPISFRTDVGQTKILSDEEFDEFIKQIKTNGPISDPKRAGAAYIPEENKVYLRETGPSSNAYHEYLHQGFYGLRNPYVTEGRIGQLIDENKVKSLNPKQATYYLSTTEFPVHLRQNGENMGINVGDPYPGDEVFDKMLFDNPIFGSAHYVKRNTPEEKRLFGRALNGTLFGITGLSLMPHNNK